MSSSAEFSEESDYQEKSLKQAYLDFLSTPRGVVMLGLVGFFMGSALFPGHSHEKKLKPEVKTRIEQIIPTAAAVVGEMAVMKAAQIPDEKIYPDKSVKNGATITFKTRTPWNEMFVSASMLSKNGRLQPDTTYEVDIMENLCWKGECQGHGYDHDVISLTGNPVYPGEPYAHAGMYDNKGNEQLGDIYDSNPSYTGLFPTGDSPERVAKQANWTTYYIEQDAATMLKFMSDDRVALIDKIENQLDLKSANQG